MRQVVEQAVDVLLGHQRIGIVCASLAPIEAAARGMSGPVARELPLHGRRVLRVVVEADVHHLVVQQQRGQPAIEGDLARTGGHGHAAGVFLPDTQRIGCDLDALRSQQVHQVRQVGQRKRALRCVSSPARLLLCGARFRFRLLGHLRADLRELARRFTRVGRPTADKSLSERGWAMARSGVRQL